MYEALQLSRPVFFLTHWGLNELCPILLYWPTKSARSCYRIGRCQAQDSNTPQRCRADWLLRWMLSNDWGSISGTARDLRFSTAKSWRTNCRSCWLGKAAICSRPPSMQQYCEGQLATSRSRRKLWMPSSHLAYEFSLSLNKTLGIRTSFLILIKAIFIYSLLLFYWVWL